jgi:hypothetical protein
MRRSLLTIGVALAICVIAQAQQPDQAKLNQAERLNKLLQDECRKPEGERTLTRPMLELGVQEVRRMLDDLQNKNHPPQPKIELSRPPSFDPRFAA